jgi:hypothetical protein
MTAQAMQMCTGMTSHARSAALVLLALSAVTVALLTSRYV